MGKEGKRDCPTLWTHWTTGQPNVRLSHVAPRATGEDWTACA